MTLTTSQARRAWQPPCAGPFARVTLNGGGLWVVDPRIVDAVLALDDVLRYWGYVTRKADTGAYNCRRITGGTGYSLHAHKIAGDINWTTNPYGRVLVTDMPEGMRNDIKRIRTRDGHQVWVAGADFEPNNDAMHYQIGCTPAQLATGIDPATVRRMPDKPPPTPTPGEPPMSAADIEALNARLDVLAREVTALQTKIEQDGTNTRARIGREQMKLVGEPAVFYLADGPTGAPVRVRIPDPQVYDWLTRRGFVETMPQWIVEVTEPAIVTWLKSLPMVDAGADPTP